MGGVRWGELACCECPPPFVSFLRCLARTYQVSLEWLAMLTPYLPQAFSSSSP